MPVLYDGYSVRPAPLVSLTKERQTLGDGRTVGSVIRATLTGKIVAENLSGTHVPVEANARLSVILEQQALLREKFSVDGKLFEIVGWDGEETLKFNAIVRSITFEQGTWFDTCDYTIQLEGDGIDGDEENDHIDTASETWQFEEAESRTFRATHTVSAKGKVVYDAAGAVPKKAWQFAKDYCKNKLGLGWDFTSVDSPLSGGDLALISEVAPSTEEWNRTVQESIDETDGSYSVTETFILTPDPWVEDYSVSVRRSNEPNFTTRAAISGSIRGLSKTQNDHTGRYTAASTRWTTVKTLLLSRCNEAASKIGGASLSTHPISVSVNPNPVEGTISYEYEFDDTTYEDDTLEIYTVTPSVSVEDHRTSVRVEGTITGQSYLDDLPDKTIRFQRASLRWNVVKPLLLARAITKSGVLLLRPFPVTAQANMDESTGTISYTYEFDDRVPTKVREEISVSRRFARDDGFYSVSVDGTITGLRNANSANPYGTGDYQERYNNALEHYAVISTNLVGVASRFVEIGDIKPVPIATSVSHNEAAGSISFTTEYSSKSTPCTAGALSESITITDDEAVPVIAEFVIPGKPDGPIFQDINTITKKRRAVSIEIVMPPPSNACVAIQPTISTDSYAPTGTFVRLEQSQTQWSPTGGRLTKNISWIYK